MFAREVLSFHSALPPGHNPKLLSPIIPTRLCRVPFKRDAQLPHKPNYSHTLALSVSGEGYGIPGDGGCTGFLIRPIRRASKPFVSPTCRISVDDSFVSPTYAKTGGYPSCGKCRRADILDFSPYFLSFLTCQFTLRVAEGLAQRSSIEWNTPQGLALSALSEGFPNLCGYAILTPFRMSAPWVRVRPFAVQRRSPHRATPQCRLNEPRVHSLTLAGPIIPNSADRLAVASDKEDLSCLGTQNGQPSSTRRRPPTPSAAAFSLGSFEKSASPLASAAVIRTPIHAYGRLF